MSGLLDYEDVLLARLREFAPEGVTVYSASGLDDVLEKTRRVPAWHLIYGGYSVVKNSSGGTSAQIRQRWLVAIVTRGARQSETGSTLPRLKAAEQLPEVQAALMGWRPGGRSTPLMLADAPSPVFTESSAVIPLVFTQDQVIDNSKE